MSVPARVKKLLVLGSTLFLVGFQSVASSQPLNEALHYDESAHGTIHHLTGEGLVLRAGVQQIEIRPNVTQFRVDAAKGGELIQVEKQPSGQFCKVDNHPGWSDGETATIYCETVLTRPMSLEVAGARLKPSLDRIFVPVRLGDSYQDVYGILDTGSAGAVLNAFQLFPESILSQQGFRFPHGSHRISYDGMIITDAVVKKMFGGKGDQARSVIGNLGFAQVSFGRGDGIVTGMVPVLFVYARESEKGTNPLKMNDSSANIIGINSDQNTLRSLDYDAAEKSSPPIQAACDDQLATNCGLISPLRRLMAVPGVDPGFLLSRVPMSDCSMSSLERCPRYGNLTIGLTEELTRGFVKTEAKCRDIADGHDTLNICIPVINDVTISADGDTFHGSALFDTGNPKLLINVPTGARFHDDLPRNADLCVSVASDVVYRDPVFHIGENRITVNQNTKNYSNVGVPYFEEHSFFTNYHQHTLGFRE